MNKAELDRLVALEKRIKEIAKEFGLLTTEIDFEVVSSQRMLEGMAYMLPSNFSHWSFGRDYEKFRTIYEHTGTGIPYEQVWNLEKPKALVVETNPFALKVLIMAHVYGHVDYFLGNSFLKHGNSFSDIADEARRAAKRFKDYENKYGLEEVERTVEAGMSIQWQQPADPFLDEELDNELARQRLMAMAKARLESNLGINSQFQNPKNQKELNKIEKQLKALSRRTPPEPIYDLLGYIIRYSPILKPWQQDVLTVIRNQARSLAPNRRTKLADEGWACYWHVQIMRRLFAEGLLSAKEHGIFNEYHSAVTKENKTNLNWYCVGLAIFEDIKERWDKGRFGREYEECSEHIKRSNWDTGEGLGNKKLFEVRSHYSDRMIIEEFFTDEFIKAMRLFFYNEETDQNTGTKTYTIVENRPETIRQVLKSLFTLYGVIPIRINSSNYEGQSLYLKHEYSGIDLDPVYRRGVMEYIHHLWGHKVFLESAEKVERNSKQTVYSFNGEKHEAKK